MLAPSIAAALYNCWSTDNIAVVNIKIWNARLPQTPLSRITNKGFHECISPESKNLISSLIRPNDFKVKFNIPGPVESEVLNK